MGVEAGLFKAAAIERAVVVGYFQECSEFCFL